VRSPVKNGHLYSYISALRNRNFVVLRIALSCSVHQKNIWLRLTLVKQQGILSKICDTLPTSVEFCNNLFCPKFFGKSASLPSQQRMLSPELSTLVWKYCTHSPFTHAGRNPALYVIGYICDFVCLCVCCVLFRKMAWATNTKLATHTVIPCMAQQALTMRSKVKVTWLSYTLPA